MKKLLVLIGPTGVGKTELSIALAKHYNCPIISADSRQIYKGLEIGTAAATEEQRLKVKHFLVGNLDVSDYYSASDFENEALDIIKHQHEQHDVLIVTGGSMMYIDALCNGIDEMPNIDNELRKQVLDLYHSQGLEAVQGQLKILDPKFYEKVDIKNYKRVIHALEVCLMTGQPYSSFRTSKRKVRSFDIIKVGLMRERQDLYQHINRRVDNMMKLGMLNEAKQFYPQRELNSLNTVGYKELFVYMDGEWTLDFAIEKIKQNTRIYSRKQMTWFKRDKDINWINLSERSMEDALSDIIKLI